MDLENLDDLSSLDFDDDEEKEEVQYIEANVQQTIQEPIKADDADIDEDGNLVYKDAFGNPIDYHKEDLDDEDLITSILKSRNIDPEAVNIEDESGNINTVKFSDLSKEEQLDILNAQDVQDNNEDSEYDLDDDEIDLINAIRNANLSPKEYLNNYRDQILREAYQQDASNTVDSLTDDELFLADLRSKVPDITDDEATQALEIEKTNEDLFNKKMNAMRDSYKQLEAQQLEQSQNEAKQQEAERYAEFENQIVNAIQDASNGIDLGNSMSLAWTTDDMNEIASFILDEDATGQRYLAKALGNPQTLVEMAWFALKGKEALSQISDYYKAQITEASKTNYNKGYEDAQKGNKKNEVKTVVRKPSRSSNIKRELSIEDLDY